MDASSQGRDAPRFDHATLPSRCNRHRTRPRARHAHALLFAVTLATGAFAGAPLAGCGGNVVFEASDCSGGSPSTTSLSTSSTNVATSTNPNNCDALEPELNACPFGCPASGQALASPTRTE